MMKATLVLQACTKVININETAHYLTKKVEYPVQVAPQKV